MRAPVTGVLAGERSDVRHHSHIANLEEQAHDHNPHAHHQPTHLARVRATRLGCIRGHHRRSRSHETPRRWQSAVTQRGVASDGNDPRTLDTPRVRTLGSRATGTLLGRIGCQQPEGFPGFEIAYTLGRAYWGRGYAREGAGAALAYAREVLGRTNIISVIRPANAASIRVAQSLGATLDGEVEFFGGPSSIYRYQ